MIAELLKLKQSDLGDLQSKHTEFEQEVTPWGVTRTAGSLVVSAGHSVVTRAAAGAARACLGLSTSLARGGDASSAKSALCGVDFSICWAGEDGS